MNAALANEETVIRAQLWNWARWCLKGNTIRLGYTVQSWQKFVKCGQSEDKPVITQPVDNTAAEAAQREFVQVAYYHPVEAFAGKVYFLDNYSGRMTREDMAKDCARKFRSGCSVATFYRRVSDFEELMEKRLLGGSRRETLQTDH